ncbi:hypothetical protein VP1G_05308 [Cytospora mali]|uniref:CorA-like transporter domain-containing protein n=1 Tax=Cytospora mali TaxID=578113 RepID=A0A194V2D3_CYTMA|nr:hypothetical protein VP1G_05308 [Valsa mali var. pyri (nom. inval.)]
MFRYICSYQQMSPIFIDMLASFGTQYRRMGFHCASFSQDDLNKPLRPAFLQIDEIGRSDWELRHCYKLNGIELSDFDQKWTMRQTAMYHSFDMGNGRAFWLSIKANNEIRDRIRDGTQSLETMKARNLNTLGTSFEACLETHLIPLDWCAEGWRWYINTVESRIREVFHKIKSYPLDPAAGEPDPPQQLARALSMPLFNRTESAMSLIPGTKRTQTLPVQTTSAVTARLSSRQGDKDKLNEPDSELELDNMPTQRRETTHERYENISKRLEMMRTFSFSEFQKLNDVASKLKEAKLAMALNTGVLRDIRGYYQALVTSSTFPSEIREACSSTAAFDQFVQRTNSLEKHLEAECMRADALIALVQDGITLYNSILESYNTEVNKFFALSGHDISKRMEDSAMRMEAVTDSMYDIARQTARDSSSMHVITFFTLVFLPGTFIGTFFSTPILSTPDSTNPQSWNINNALLLLFFKICVPMMFVTVTAWYLYLKKTWFRRNAAVSDGEDVEASAGMRAG